MEETKMKKPVRKSLLARLDVTNIEFEIKRMSVECNYHTTKAKLFEQALFARQEELDEILGVSKQDVENGEIYK
jgi:hypothetical protein